VDVRDVQLDEPAREHLERVHERHGRERERCRVDDDAQGSPVDGLVDPLDELVLPIGLPEDKRTAIRGFAAHGLDVRQRRAAIDLRLTRAEAVEVRPLRT
jgi:hypothetical protein